MVADQAKEIWSAENTNAEQEGPTGSAHAAEFGASLARISGQPKSNRIPNPFAPVTWTGRTTQLVYEQST
jgi:hypothetical protein